MRKIVLLTFMVFSFAGISAQEVEFTADRPGASTGPSVVSRGVIQWEQGVQYDGDGAKGSFTFSNTLFRYGLFNGVELRMGGDAFSYDYLGNWKSAFTGISIGTKIHCCDEQGAIPAVSVLADFQVPGTGTNGFVADHLAPSLYLLFENTLNDKLSLGYNVGAEWDGALPAPTTFLAIGVGYAINEDLGCFAESYNYLAKGGNAYCADLGVNYMVARKVQIDMAANIDLCNPAQCWAVSFGVAWQINK